MNQQLSTPSNILEHIHDIHLFIVEQLKIAKTLQSHYANKKRIDKQFSIGDKVMLDTSNLVIRNQRNKKLKQRYLGPYSIVKVISPDSYELQLPGTMQIHPVFHVSKLKETNNPDSPIDIVPAIDESKDEYQVERILDYKVDVCPNRYKKGLCLLFLVRWALPYTSNDDSWEPYVLLKNVDALHSFVRTNSAFQTFMNSQEYDQYHKQYKARFPRQI